MFELYNDDCLKIMPTLEEKSVDMILCDLPYGKTNCKWDIVIPFEDLWQHYNRIVKDDGAIVLFGTQPFTSQLICSNINNFKYEWVWEKQKASNFMTAKYMPLKYHENILVFNKNGSTKAIKYFPQKYKVIELNKIQQMNAKELKTFFDNREYDKYGKVDRRNTINNNSTNKQVLGIDINRVRNSDDGYRYPKSVIKINKSINGNVHPTQKPIALLEYLIKTYTQEGETVLDNCMGSGSTGVACLRTGRNFIGIEKDERYFNVAKERLDTEKAQMRFL